MPRLIHGIGSFNLTNNVTLNGGRCGGPKKSDTPNRFYWSLIKNRSNRTGRPQSATPLACNSKKIYFLYIKPNRILV